MSKEDTYIDPCPKCGCRFIGISKQEYIEHLRENGETLAAKIEEEMVVDETETLEKYAKRRECPYCGEEKSVIIQPLPHKIGDKKTQKVHCKSCGWRWVEKRAES